ELFVGFGGGEREFGREASFAQLLDEAEAFIPERFVLDENEGIDSGVEFWHELFLQQKISQNNVAHAETQRRKIHLPAGDQFDEIVVATAASDGTHGGAFGKSFENHAGVVGETANNAVVDLDEWIQFPAAEVA